jgi:hypothetical protein
MPAAALGDADLLALSRLDADAALARLDSAAGGKLGQHVQQGDDGTCLMSQAQAGPQRVIGASRTVGGQQKLLKQVAFLCGQRGAGRG